MYDVEKRSAVLKNAAGFARLDAYIYGPVTKGRIGVCLYSGEANFAFPPSAVRFGMPTALSS